MKRTKFIMLAVVVALALMGAGYAAWTQMFRLESNVSTGELFVKINNSSNYYEVLDADGEVVSKENLDTQNDYLDLSVDSTVEGEGTDRETLTQLVFNLNKLYPGVRVTSVITFENLGTLKVVTDVDNNTIVLPSEDDLVLLDALEVKVNGVTVTGSGYDKFNNLVEAITGAIGELEPGDDVSVEIIQGLPYESGDATEGLDLEWVIPLVFKQQN